MEGVDAANPQKILITGAAGRIGRYLTGHLGQKHSLLLTDIHEPENQSAYPFVQCDVTDLGMMRTLAQGVDTIIHLAGNPNPSSSWEDLLQPNIIGAYTIFQAAHQAGCRRLIFASSGRVGNGHPRGDQITLEMPVRPADLYGVSKVWGETLGQYYADQKGLSTICLRLGWVLEKDHKFMNPRQKELAQVLTYSDMAQLFSLCIEAPNDIRFAIFNGVSNNRWQKLDISRTREVLGYEPQDDSYALAEQNEERRLVEKQRENRKLSSRIKRRLKWLYDKV